MMQKGYKAFRNYMVRQLDDFQLKAKVVVLYGLTCTGKTALLQQLPNSIDLEGLAQHRGSLMGALGLQPHKQKKFENLLLKRLRELQDQDYIFIEGESRRIGDVIIPAFLYKAMLKGIKINIHRDIEKRAEAMAEEYFKKEHLQELKNIVQSFNRLISKDKKNEVVNLIDQGKHQQAAKIILEYYYDPLYKHTLDKLNYAFEVNSDDIKKGLEELKEKIKN